MKASPSSLGIVRPCNDHECEDQVDENNGKTMDAVSSELEYIWKVAAIQKEITIR